MSNSYIDKGFSVEIDETDRALLRLLQTQARMSITELAEQVNLSATPCARRIKRLEDTGIITGYHTQTDAQKLGYPLAVFIAISMDRHTAERFEIFESKIQSFDEVVSCSIVTGRTEDYLIKVRVRDMAHYEEFLLHRLNRIEGVAQVHTSFELREVFSRNVV
ncbi:MULTISPECIES: Lrp/AsnC family transcriptional regulator [Psychrobacter]|uniref:Lrp/AsnC family transcriptional regulator n=1 Tax=Psychrobacter halodurans TaxID=2818439 RepID=A0AAW4IQZ9_9GAMM|nr:MULTISPECIES: Lrp/AsnC family transcriptional regulator [Psychrobacter]MBO1517883.1 Lrp/AsnC family transcriptional regulator [Psychrobacter halodurans]MDE0491722.1 Lrp/AsnC family transcriptional regulator [Psychrobacter sp. A3]MDN5665783.1 Lrp/AsnC family transcriptional regulator [Psychrobacter sp.]MDN5732821.1 Lrp/AsnC family transcriptional regulator [Psychrobacter sp.]PJX24304.1 AsnC family transcriptional regulator [Psychrobacter sp. L7]